MDNALTREQVLALAPDASSAKAAQGLVSDSKWVSLGADADAVWGQCQGSGAKPYQSQVDLASMVARCSCPSRKFPCKHGLALLLLFTQRNPRFQGATRPAWVDEWLGSRREKAAKKEQVAQAAAARTEADPEAAGAAVAKREAARWKRIESGSAELQRWIADQFRRGLAKFGPEQRGDWTAMAARLVDAQAPGAGTQLQQALRAMCSGVAGYAEAAQRLGLLQLLNEGVRRRDSLSPARLADVRAALGWPLDKEQVLADSEAVSDRWHVLGECSFELDGKLSERRVWLLGAQTQRFALLQDFAYGGKGWEGALQRNRGYAGTLRFFPGSVPLRVLAQDLTPLDESPAQPEADERLAIDRISHAFANNPWLPQFPLLCSGATVVAGADAWHLHCASSSYRLQLDEASSWSLLAFTGGHPVTAMGEWDGRAVRPLAAWNERGDYWSLASA